MMFAQILVTGPFSLEKNILISHVSDQQFSGREVPTTVDLAQCKGEGLDLGILNVDDGLEAHLIHMPGESSFNWWDIFAKGALGGILLVDSASERSINEAKEVIGAWVGKPDFSLVIGATKQDLPGAMSLEGLAKALGSKETPMFAVDALERSDNLMLVMAVLHEMLLVGEEASDDVELEMLY